VTRLLGHAMHGFENEDGQLGANLIGVQVSGFDRPAEARRRVPRASLIHHERHDVISALLAGAKLRMRLGEVHVQLTDNAFQRASHPAIGNG
jgi:hypothetical protein